jgi:hypothetical protein
MPKRLPQRGHSSYAAAEDALTAEGEYVEHRAHPGIDTPSDAERSTMAALAISCKDGVYSFAGFDYHHLSDAVHFATLAHGSDGQDHPG